MKQSKEQNEAYKLVAQINHGINGYMNAKLVKLCELDSADDDDYPMLDEECKTLKRRKIENWDLEKRDDV